MERAAVIAPVLGEMVGGDNILKIIESVSPEGGVPDPVYLFDRPIFFFQPFPKFFLAVFAVAFPTVLVGDVPCDKVVIFSVTIRKFCGERHSVFLIGGAVGAGIVAAAEFALHAVCLHPQDIGMLSSHPCGVRPGGGGEAHFHAVLFHQLHNLVQLIEMIDVVVGL